MRLPYLLVSVVLAASVVQAQDFSNAVYFEISPKLVNADALGNSYIKDFNGNGVIEIIAFGDSLTKGVGDFLQPGEDIGSSEQLTHPASEAGYPLRLEGWLGLDVANRGSSGERISEGGVSRFAALIPGLRPDVVIILEGANDGFARLTQRAYFHDLQTVVNIARASGALPVLVTIVPPCCNHSGLTAFIPSYNGEVRRAAAINAVPLADVSGAYSTTCRGEECHLLNLPEGIHPNSAGYDVIGETVVAALLNIDILAPGGAASVEAALNLPPGTIKTRPAS